MEFSDNNSMKKRIESKLPKYLAPYFWDVEFNKLDPNKSKKFIITRLLELGNQRTLKWLINNYNLKIFRQVLQTTRELSPRSANFWVIYFNFDKKKIKCLQKHYLKQRQKVWPY